VVAVQWTPVSSGDGRFFVYSARFGSTHLVTSDVESSAVFRHTLGLSRTSRRDSLSDPAGSVRLSGAFEKPLQLPPGAASGQPRKPGRLLPRLYLLFHRHRVIFSIPRAIGLCKLLLWLRGRRDAQSLADIGELVKTIEDQVGISDCYPRALLTAYLCLAAQRPSQIVVGILAPTTRLHAWCCVHGIIPYEPVDRNWWYQPLVIFDAP
jgi:hypothetical protein